MKPPPKLKLMPGISSATRRPGAGGVLGVSRTEIAKLTQDQKLREIECLLVRRHSVTSIRAIAAESLGMERHEVDAAIVEIRALWQQESDLTTREQRRVDLRMLAGEGLRVAAERQRRKIGEDGLPAVDERGDPVYEPDPHLNAWAGFVKILGQIDGLLTPAPALTDEAAPRAADVWSEARRLARERARPSVIDAGE